MTQLVIPMAGLGSRFSEAGYKTSKPLLPVGDFRLFEVVVSNLWHHSISKLILVTRDGDLATEDTASLSSALGRPVHNFELPKLSDGPASSVALAASFLDPDEPLVIANSDQYIDADLSSFYERLELDNKNQIVTMEADDAKWSFVRVDGAQNVIEVKEKCVISNIATVGIYGFASARRFLEGFSSMERAGDRTNGELYVAPVFNYLSSEETKIFHLGPLGDVMHGLGVPQDYEFFLQKGPYLKAVNSAKLKLGERG